MFKNMNLKKIFVLLTAVLMLFTMTFAVGCNKNNENKDNGDGDKPQTEATYALSALKKTINIDQEYQLEVVGVTDETVTWIVYDKTVASVTDNGLVKGLKEGSTKVLARVGDKELVCEIIVQIKLVEYAEICLPNESDYNVNLRVGDTYVFVPELKGVTENAQITLTSDSASVTVNGYSITAVSAVENAKITFSCSLSGVAPLVVYVTVQA